MVFYNSLINFMLYDVLDSNFLDKSDRTKIVRFAYVPKKFDKSDQFFWLRVAGNSILCTAQNNYFYFWEFNCSAASIKSAIILELCFDSKVAVLENNIQSLSSHLYFLNEKESYLKSLNIIVKQKYSKSLIEFRIHA